MEILTNKLRFLPVGLADKDGVIAIGGDLGTDRLLLAYRSGIFPWYNEDEPIIWWSPDPRFVLFPAELKVSKSMQAILNNNQFQFTINKVFSRVIKNCKTVSRKGQDGTWITAAIQNAYIKMHQLGHAHSAEAWQNGKLAGGLYGIRIGNVFFGESMFSTVSNASKFAFINYVQQLQKENVVLIDCQVYTQHLQSLGACMMERKKFIQLLSQHC